MDIFGFRPKKQAETNSLNKESVKAKSLACRIKAAASKNSNPSNTKNGTHGEVIAVTFGKKTSGAQLAKQIKESNCVEKGIIILQDDQDFQKFQATQKQKKTPQTVVAVEPSRWPNWKNINHKLLSPKRNSLFVIDNSMEVMYCADGEIKVSSKGKIKKEYKDISFF